MSWKRYAAERTVASAGWLLVVALAVFVIYHLLAPFPQRLAGPTHVEENRERALDYFAEDLGDYFGRLAHGSLGESIAGGSDVNQMVAQAAPVTISVALGAIAVAMLIGGPVGLVWSGRRLRGAYFVGHLTLALIPVWLGVHLSYWVGFRAEITPIAGYCDLFFPARAAQCGGPVDWAYHLVLPWTTLAVPIAFLYARVVRALADDVRAAVAAAPPADRAAVFARRRRAAAVALVRHVTRDFGILLGFAVFVEVFFGLPGLASLLLQSTYVFEYPLGEAIDAPIGEGIVLSAALLALAVHLAVDLVVAGVAAETRPA